MLTLALFAAIFPLLCRGMSAEHRYDLPRPEGPAPECRLTLDLAARPYPGEIERTTCPIWGIPLTSFTSSPDCKLAFILFGEKLLYPRSLLDKAEVSEVVLLEHIDSFRVLISAGMRSYAYTLTQDSFEETSSEELVDYLYRLKRMHDFSAARTDEPIPTCSLPPSLLAYREMHPKPAVSHDSVDDGIGFRGVHPRSLSPSQIANGAAEPAEKKDAKKAAELAPNKEDKAAELEEEKESLEETKPSEEKGEVAEEDDEEEIWSDALLPEELMAICPECHPIPELAPSPASLLMPAGTKVEVGTRDLLPALGKLRHPGGLRGSFESMFREKAKELKSSGFKLDPEVTETLRSLVPKKLTSGATPSILHRLHAAIA